MPSTAGNYNETAGNEFVPPAITLPKGGGAIRGVGEKFAANPVTGTGSITVPIAASPGRSGFGPTLSLSYDSGTGNGPFGLGWNLSLPEITRKTDKGLPTYQDAAESDTFILSGSEDLTPVLVEEGGEWLRKPFVRSVDGVNYQIQRYRPRIEGLFSRIERWVNRRTSETHWRSITRDNVTTLYGKTAESRIADPADGSRVFSWLICESYDDKGNAIRYEYAAEDSAGIATRAHERNRTGESRSANRYLKRIKYGNLPSRLVEPDLSRMRWLFEVVFDYGEGHYDLLPVDDRGRQFVRALKDQTGEWPARQDPFSSYRAGFEVRTYRLCRRVLMFHHFPEELGADDYLVRATEFNYTESSLASFINEVTQSGYVRSPDGTYLRKSLPPVEFEYSDAVIDDRVHEVDAESLENLPYGLDGSRYRWVDLDGEGIPGILTEQGNTWFYKANLGGGRFGAQQVVATKPSLAALNTGTQQLLDLAGDGQLDLVQFSSPAGFYERTQDQRWEPFTPFVCLPNIRFDDPNLRLVDLTGDGHADILITEDEALTWYPSLAELGFGQAERGRQHFDEESGPRVVFADGTQSIFLADMSGDGLSDLVRIRNGEVCYWPSLGYGRFGAKVMMDDAPWFDTPDLFDPRHLHMADIDGSGVTDIVYVTTGGIQLYFNWSGNGWSPVRSLPQLTRTDNPSSVTVVDLLGNGTACVVWSSPLPGHSQRPMRYIDLMGGQKPHLLTKAVNNLGAETRVHYEPSTLFYLADKVAGKPWLTKLPFPVHVVERVETYDRISRNRFVTRYAYHDGYFDGIEREFRGFGMIEQWDTEAFAALSGSDVFAAGDNVDETSHVPPVMTRTWFHTGALFADDRVSKQFEEEYYREGVSGREQAVLSNAQIEAMRLRDTELPKTIRRAGQAPLPWSLSADELRQSARALKGAILRQEVYAYDGSEAADRPYTVSERNYTVELLQPLPTKRGSVDRDFAVFFVHPRESVDFHYERKLFDVGSEKLADPRVDHQMTLAVDDYGNVLHSVAIGYGRRHEDPAPILTPEDREKQRRVHLVHTENRYTNPTIQEDDYRTPLLSETLTYELLKLTPDSSQPKVTNLFRFDELVRKVQSVDEGRYDLPYNQWDVNAATLSAPSRRLIGHERTLYRANDLGGPLPLGALESMALPFEVYKLAFTPELVARTFDGRVTDAMLEEDARYVHSEGSESSWIPSGQVFYSPGQGDAPAEELGRAREHFFLPNRFRDPFGQMSTVIYDSFDLLMVEACDPLGNCVTVGERDTLGRLITPGNDYRVLQARLVMDENRNRSAVVFDALGMLVGTALMGKPEERLGDTLAGFDPDLTDDVLAAHALNPFADPHAMLQRATARLAYDLFAYHRTRNDAAPKPASIFALTRETHDADLKPGQQTEIQQSFSYSDGFGREIQKKIQAEPGPVPRRDAGDRNTVGNDNDQRWVGTGWIIFNNKGAPVRQYEPFFTATHQFEFARIAGVSSVLFYDPIGRVIATLHPNDTWEKVIFDPWHQTVWDVNDTVLLDPQTDADVAGFVAKYFEAHMQSGDWQSWYARRSGGGLGALEQAAANKAAAHAGTPTVAYYDALGRPFLTAADNGYDGDGAPQIFTTRVHLDIEGNQREVNDALGRVVGRYDYDMLGNCTHQASMEAGERWALNDVAGKPLFNWDGRGHRVRTAFDALRRPTGSFLSVGDEPERLVVRTVYGETQPNPETKNQRKQMVRGFDQAGVVTSEEYDFKGNSLGSSRQFAREYKTTLDWSGSVPLEAPTYVSRTTYDALNRPATLTAPDNSVIRPVYNEANFLERLEVRLRGADEASSFVANIDYDSKGRRTLIEYGNGAQTFYEYDPLTFRLTHLRTLRGAETLQDFSYTYDPIGNPVHIRDDAQPTVCFRNHTIEASNDYIYDAVYRLTAATGREHLGQLGGHRNPPTAPDAFNRFYARRDQPGDGNALGTYIERYVYDAAGNFLSVEHRGSDPMHVGWSRRYAYNEASLIEPTKTSNRLSSTTVGGNNPATESYAYDALGNMTRMSHLPLMQWDYRNQLQASSRQVVNGDGKPETTWYVYDAGGQRARKVTEYQTPGQAAAIKSERFYLGSGFEVYRKYDPGGDMPKLERKTLHIMDDKRRVALIETRTHGSDPAPGQVIRYQLANHLGSSVLELDEDAAIISFEEYYPYGSTSYQAVRSQTELPKRYRFTGMERDEETGLNYHTARYYAPWLGRWTACDPIGINGGVNVYIYVSDNPIRKADPSGLGFWRRALGGLKAVGGALETAAGAALVGVGVASSEIGVGIPIAAAGVFVTAHGADTTVAGVRQLVSGEDTDTLTSQGLQAAGVSRGTANLVDAGISIAGTLGAGALTRSGPAAATVADELVSHADDAVSVADDLVTHADDAVSVADDLVSHADDAVSVADDLVSHADDAVNAADELVSRADDAVSVADELVSRADDAVSVTEDLASHADDVASTAAQTNASQAAPAVATQAAPTVATQAAGQTVRSSSQALGRALEVAGNARAANSAAHHIVAGTARAAAPARAVLARFGIGINEAANGVFLPANRAAAAGGTAIAHSTAHTRAYYTAVNELLGQATTREQALEALDTIRAGLLNGGFP